MSSQLSDVMRYFDKRCAAFGTGVHSLAHACCVLRQFNLATMAAMLYALLMLMAVGRRRPAVQAPGNRRLPVAGVFAVHF